jgi:hypothetical protein
MMRRRKRRRRRILPSAAPAASHLVSTVTSELCVFLNILHLT